MAATDDRISDLKRAVRQAEGDMLWCRDNAILAGFAGYDIMSRLHEASSRYRKYSSMLAEEKVLRQKNRLKMFWHSANNDAAGALKLAALVGINVQLDIVGYDPGITPLMISAIHGARDAAIALAPISQCSLRSSTGFTAMHYAVARRHIGVLRALIPYVDARIKNNAGHTALMLACSTPGNADLVKTLVNLGYLSDRSLSGVTSRHIAQAFGHDDYVKILDAASKQD